MSKRLVITSLMLLFLTTAGAPLWAQKQPIEAPQQDLKVLRFLTSNDYPPFNYYDEEGNLSGLNIDLAYAICRELSVTCDIREKSWDDLIPTFKSGGVDAIIAGIAINSKNQSQLDFTRTYMRMPARFAILKTRPQPDPNVKNLRGKKIGVKSSTAHEAYLRRFFKGAKIISFDSQNQANRALQQGKIDYLFGDAIHLMFWLNGFLSKQCCQFHGQAYWDADYFGEGLAIAIPKGSIKLRIALNQAINNLRASGQFEELTLRYFPMKIY